MSKPFFEVFPTLKVKDDIQMMFQGVEVTKVSTNSTRDFIRVSLYSRHLIQKKHIYEVERLLKQQLFARSHIQVSVKEQYDLSEQYTPENLMNEYYDSFLMELDQRSVVERNMLQNASYEFDNLYNLANNLFHESTIDSTEYLLLVIMAACAKLLRLSASNINSFIFSVANSVSYPFLL